MIDAAEMKRVLPEDLASAIGSDGAASCGEPVPAL